MSDVRTAVGDLLRNDRGELIEIVSVIRSEDLFRYVDRNAYRGIGTMERSAIHGGRADNGQPRKPLGFRIQKDGVTWTDKQLSR